MTLGFVVGAFPGVGHAANLTGTVTLFPVEAGGPSIAAGPDRNLWFSVHGRDIRVAKITTEGQVTTFPTGTRRGIHSLVAGPDGNLWFTEHFEDVIYRMTTAGAITGRFPIPSGSEVWDITAGPDGALWFTENMSQQLRCPPDPDEPPPDGGPIRIASEEPIRRPIGQPGGCETVLAGHDGIGRITIDGEITEFAIRGPEDGTRPIAAIAAGPDGALWFSEAGAIGRITTAGVVTEFPVEGLERPAGITAGPDGAIWFIKAPNSIGRLDPRTGTVTEFAVPGEPFMANGSGEMSDQITVGPDGALWFTHFAEQTIGRITTDGRVTEYPAGAPATDLTTGPDGNIWFSTRTGYVGRLLIAPGGRPLSAILAGANEVPVPGDPDGSGTVTITVNPGRGEVCYQITVKNIAPATAAHIHSGRAGQAGPVVVTLEPPRESNPPPFGLELGDGGESESAPATVSNCASVSRELARSILRNPSNYYVNVHNAEFPAGAVRGQLG